jgi:hypothetical protein
MLLAGQPADSGFSQNRASPNQTSVTIKSITQAGSMVGSKYSLFDFCIEAVCSMRVIE